MGKFLDYETMMQAVGTTETPPAYFMRSLDREWQQRVDEVLMVFKATGDILKPYASDAVNRAETALHLRIMDEAKDRHERGLLSFMESKRQHPDIHRLIELYYLVFSGIGTVTLAELDIALGWPTVVEAVS